MCLKLLPKGCCDTGWYDVFFGGSQFARLAQMMPAGTSPLQFSTNVNWTIAPRLANCTQTIGLSRDGEIVWSLQAQFPSNNPARWLECYNVATKASLFNPISATTLGYSISNDMLDGLIGDNVFAVQSRDASTTPINVIDTAGTIDNWGKVTGVIGTPGGSNWSGWSVTNPTSYTVLPARGNWPMFACGRNNGSLFVCNVDRPSPGSTHLQALGTTELPSGYETGWQWMSFDAYEGTWAAIVRKNNTSLGKDTYALLIDGNTIWNREVTRASVFGQMNVHVCFPHEMLEGAFVAVSELNATQNEFNLAIYRDGVESWRSVDLGFPPTLYGSTDRWIYFDTALLSVPTVTGGVFVSSIGQPANSWIVKHDGSEILPTGTVTDTKYSIRPWGYFLQRMYTHARRSNLPNSLPADYDTMYGNRNNP